MELSHPCILEVIPMVSKAYRATRVNDVDWDRLAAGNESVNITLGIDVGNSPSLASLSLGDRTV